MFEQVQEQDKWLMYLNADELCMLTVTYAPTTRMCMLTATFTPLTC